MKTLVNLAIVVICLMAMSPCTGFSAQDMAGQASVTSASVISVNSANADQLQSLPGIGEVTARRIVDYRAAHGPFAKAEDLLNVKGVGHHTLDKIRSRISLN